MQQCEGSSGRGASGDGGDPEPLVSTVRRGENAFAAGFRSGSITEILRADQARARLVFHGADADLKSPRSFVPLHPPDGCAPVGTCGRYFVARARVKRTAGAFIGQAKTD